MQQRLGSQVGNKDDGGMMEVDAMTLMQDLVKLDEKMIMKVMLLQQEEVVVMSYVDEDLMKKEYEHGELVVLWKMENGL